mmetsp:Transcript_18979/g.40880  ORF Transcript_18979/g.40880 Transcript_18979/m.40880 type:complete len:196 (-) Transcript_18979:409-996(-)
MSSINALLRTGDEELARKLQAGGFDLNRDATECLPGITPALQEAMQLTRSEMARVQVLIREGSATTVPPAPATTVPPAPGGNSRVKLAVQLGMAVSLALVLWSTWWYLIPMDAITMLYTINMALFVFLGSGPIATTLDVAFGPGAPFRAKVVITISFLIVVALDVNTLTKVCERDVWCYIRNWGGRVPVTGAVMG